MTEGMWTKCSCGHIAQAHNKALAWSKLDHVTGPLTEGPVSGKPNGYWTKEDVEAVDMWGCDECGCCAYDGQWKLVGSPK